MNLMEKLGSFYLGKVYDTETRGVKEELLLYDAKDLTTHGVCVGMTGSGKTGLCVTLLEEAAIDGIPAIAIDPKGDLGNLLLTFPDLRAESFLPWIDSGEAARKGHTPDRYARVVADLWKKGLQEWGQDGSRIQRFRDSCEAVVYTPGSTAGRPISVLKSLKAPNATVVREPDLMRERILSTVSGILALLGIEADPIRSREHILLSLILDAVWKEGRDLGLVDLIRAIQAPPFESVGILDLESFYPSKERFDLAMLLNNLAASPGFAAWTQGEALDIGRMLYSPDGKPRLSIISIAHLSEPERMFFVTILLSEMVAWMRGQPGTTSLRALLYMDEIFGFFPPSSNPPSKTPMLTLLKQARAYGLGVLLATQNPVDLDYKGLSNTGTWFIGRLQTERDKLRIMDGLEGVAAGGAGEFDRGKMEETIASLGSRVFLMHNVHEDSPVIFHTRWALSYLRGPLTRSQIQMLTEGTGPAPEQPAAAAPAAPLSGVEAKVVKAEPEERPVVPPEIRERFLPPSGDRPSGGSLLYRPRLYASAKLHFVQSKSNVDEWQSLFTMVGFPDKGERVSWDEADVKEREIPELESKERAGGRFGALPPSSVGAKNYSAWKNALAAYLYQERRLTLYRCGALGLVSMPGEAEAEFRARAVHGYREIRDLDIEKLRTKYAPKVARLQERIRKAEERIDREKDQYGQQKLQTAISVGATVLGAMFGRKLASAGNIGRAGTAMRGAGRSIREKQDIERARNEMEVLRTQLADLEAEFEGALSELQQPVEPGEIELSEIQIQPRKSDISVDAIGILWTPWAVDSEGIAGPLF